MNINTRFKIFSFLAVLCALFISAFIIDIKENRSEFGVCNGQKKWNSPDEYFACKYPNPPIGRWHAVYTKEFAKSHNLPLENISNDLSPGVDYMEMDVHPYGNGGTACLVNMLIKRPNDIAFFNTARSNNKEWSIKFNEKRKLARFIDLDPHRNKLKKINSFGVAPRDANKGTRFKRVSAVPISFYTESIVPGYDYVSSDIGCYRVITNPHLFPGNFSFSSAKASIWGKYKSRMTNNPLRPKGDEYVRSRIYLSIPKELLSVVFKDMPIGGRK